MNTATDWGKLAATDPLAVAAGDLESAARAYLTAHQQHVPGSDARRGNRHAVVVEISPDGAAFKIFPF